MNSELYAEIYNMLSSISVPVYGHVPQDLEDYPFTVLEIIKSDNGDTDLELGFLDTVQVITYSRYRGITELSDIMKEIYDILHRANVADTTSYGTSAMTQDFSTIAKDSDGITSVGIQRFTLIYEGI